MMPNSDPEWIFLSTSHHTPLIDTFSCTPSDLSLYFQSRTYYKLTLFSLRSFYSSLKRLMVPATDVRFFTFTSNLHKVTSFFDVTAVKTNVT